MLRPPTRGRRRERSPSLLDVVTTDTRWSRLQPLGRAAPLRPVHVQRTSFDSLDVRSFSSHDFYRQHLYRHDASIDDYWICGPRNHPVELRPSHFLVYSRIVFVSPLPFTRVDPDRVGKENVYHHSLTAFVYIFNIFLRYVIHAGNIFPYCLTGSEFRQDLRALLNWDCSQWGLTVIKRLRTRPNVCKDQNNNIDDIPLEIAATQGGLHWFGSSHIVCILETC